MPRLCCDTCFFPRTFCWINVRRTSEARGLFWRLVLETITGPSLDSTRHELSESVFYVGGDAEITWMELFIDNRLKAGWWWWRRWRWRRKPRLGRYPMGPTINPSFSNLGQLKHSLGVGAKKGFLLCTRQAKLLKRSFKRAFKRTCPSHFFNQKVKPVVN